MKKIAFLAMIILYIFALIPMASAITVSPFEYGTQIDAEDSAISAWYDGRWHMIQRENILVSSDAGYFGPAYALFDFSSQTIPAAGGHLSFEILRHSGSQQAFPGFYDWPYPMALYDVSDIEAIRPPPEWPQISEADYIKSFYNVKQDLTSGVRYGKFMVPANSKGMIMEVLLSDAAVAEINNSLGGLFAMGLSPGDSVKGLYFPTEGASVALGNARLHLNPVPEPLIVLLLGIGLATVGGLQRKLSNKIRPGRLSKGRPSPSPKRKTETNGPNRNINCDLDNCTVNTLIGHPHG